MPACASAGDSDVVDKPVRMSVRGSSSANELAKKSYNLDPVDQIADFGNSDTDEISFLGELHFGKS
jgi:hypothetical protein